MYFTGKGKGRLESKLNEKKEDSASTSRIEEPTTEIVTTEIVTLTIRNKAMQKFSFDQLSAAADNFKNIVGHGGFGGVYLGFLQPEQVCESFFFLILNILFIALNVIFLSSTYCTFLQYFINRTDC